jgi:plasmid stabilization system protein ParE
MTQTKDPDVLRAARHLLATRGERAARMAERRAATLDAEGEDAAARLWRDIVGAIDGIAAGRHGGAG